MIRPQKTFVLSDESVNSYGFRVLTTGIDLTDFLKNPIMLRNHAGEAIGVWENVRVKGNKLLAEPAFSESDPEILKIAKKVEEGTLKAASVGIENAIFTLDAKYKIEGQKEGTVLTCKLYEASIVEFPSNKNALVLYDGEGKLSAWNLINEYQWNHLETNRNKLKMTKETLGLLQLSENANATDVHNAIVQLQNNSKADKLLIEQLTEERNQNVVQSAFELGKINVSQTEHYKLLLKKDFNNTKKLLDSIPVPESKKVLKDVKVSDLIQRGKSSNHSQEENENEAPKDKSQWTLEHYRRFAPKELKANPALFQELLNKQRVIN